MVPVRGSRMVNWGGGGGGGSIVSWQLIEI